MNYYRLSSCDVLSHCMNISLNEMEQSQNKLRDLIKLIENNNLINKEKFMIDLLKDLGGQCIETISK